MKIKTVYINPFCGYNCEFCSGQKHLATNIQEQEIDLNKQINMAIQENCDVIKLSGKDPAEYYDIVRLITYLKSKFKYVILATNGRKTGSTNLLEYLDIDELELNIFGHNQETHELFTHTMNSFDLLTKTIQGFNKKFSINIPIGKYNKIHLKEIYNFVKNLIPENKLKINIYPLIIKNEYHISLDEYFFYVSSFYQQFKNINNINYYR